MRSITDIVDAPERSHVNVENMNQEFMKAVLEADPGMAKDATQNKLMMGLMPIMLKRSQGQALTVAERAQVQAFVAAMAVLRRLRPGVGVYLSAMMGVVLGEHGKTSIPIRIDGSVVGVACFIHKADSATGAQSCAFEIDFTPHVLAPLMLIITCCRCDGRWTRLPQVQLQGQVQHQEVRMLQSQATLQ